MRDLWAEKVLEVARLFFCGNCRRAGTSKLEKLLYQLPAAGRKKTITGEGLK
jgi:hypothetical protein